MKVPAARILSPDWTALIGTLFSVLSRPIILVVGMAILASGITGYLTARTEKTFYQNHPYFLDAAYYSLYNARLYTRLQTEPAPTVAVDEWLRNTRHPLRTVPLILLAPQMLADSMGQLATALPMLALFLGLLGWTVYQRTLNILYALASMTLYCALPGLYSVAFGLAPYWLDLHVSFLTGAAALCLLNSRGARSLGWLAAFAILVAASALSRWTAAGYVFVMCAPVYAVYVLLRWRQERSFIKAVVVPTVLVTGIIIVLAGYFMFAHSEENLEFYRKWGYALGQELIASAKWHRDVYFSIVGPQGLVLLVGIAALNLIFLRDRLRNWKWVEQLSVVWFALSFLCLQIVLLRAVGDWMTPWHAVPVLFLLAVAPAPWGKSVAISNMALVLALLMFGSSVLLVRQASSQAFRYAANPPAAIAANKQFEIQLAQALASQKQPVVWKAFFDLHDGEPTMETYYRFGKLPLFANAWAPEKPLLTPLPETWRITYPGMTPEQIASQIFDKLNLWSDIIVVYADPKDADTNFDNEYERTVSRYLSENVRTDVRWTRAFDLHSPRYGNVVGYRNLAPKAGAYDWLLHSAKLVFPY